MGLIVVIGNEYFGEVEVAKGSDLRINFFLLKTLQKSLRLCMGGDELLTSNVSEDVLFSDDPF